MTKILTLLRYAQAGGSEKNDSERPLTAQGMTMPARTAAHLRESGMVPQHILCSPALRTRQTAQLLIDALGEKPPLTIVDALYGAEPEQVLEIIRAQEDGERLMVIGHNPWVHVLALTLAAPASFSAHAAIKGLYPPAACAVFRFTILKWADVTRGTGELVDFHYPGAVPHG